MQFKTVQPPLQFIPPALNPWVLKLTQKILPWWLRYRRGINYIQATNSDRLAELYHQFQLGKTRFIIAFRHPSLDDPPCIHYLLSHIVPQVAQQHHIPLRDSIHAHFIYERGIPLWAGSLVGWLFSRIGATPIHRGKLDLVGLRTARQLFAQGSLPLAAAPEGTISGCSEYINPLEPGVAQLGFWCVEDLLKAGRFERVVILPVGIKYHYVCPNWEALEMLLTKMEADCKLPVECRKMRFTARIYHLAEHLLSWLEDFYNNFYNQSLLGVGSLDDRLIAFQNAALSTAEKYFGLQPKGNLIERRHRIEQAGWDRMYRQDIQPASLSLVESGLANQAVEMSNLYLWHMRLAENFWGVSQQYIQEKPSFERLAETSLRLWELVTFLKGDTTAKRPNLGKRWAEITVGEEISVSSRWDAYRAQRRQAVDALTQEVQTAFEAMNKDIHSQQLEPMVSSQPVISNCE